MNALTKALTKITRRTAARCLVGFFLIASGMAAQAQLKVSVMPSHAQSSSYAKAGLNEAITVWGRTWGGTGAQTYTLDFGDGTAAATGTVTNANYISASHTYTTGGLKTFTLTVTDSTSATVSRSGVIRVIATPLHTDRVHMAIDKGLLYLYQNYTVIDTDRIYWSWYSQPGHDYDVGATSSSILAFEENDHLPGEDDVEEIYAEMLRRGLNTLFGLAVSHNIGVAQHSDGIAVRDTDMNDNGRGIYLNTAGGHNAYSTPFAGMAIILAKRNSAEAQASTVPYGTFAGTNYNTFVQDMVDQMHWTQGDDSYRGGYGYAVATQSQARYDGSSQQWPALMLLAAEERLSIHTPQWWMDNAAYGFNVLQAANGGIGYSDANGWRNVAKTGGALALYAFAGRFAGTDTNATNARNYVQNLWANNPSWSGDQAGWTGQWYAMWALKKGLQLQGITTVQTPGGARNWKQDMQAWLLGNATLLDSQGTGVPVSSGSYRTANYMFGQAANGRWVSQESPGSNGLPIDTAHGVLILSESVARPVPVAVIAPVGSQSNRVASRAFGMNGSGSYHLDANSAIIEYLWDWDASNGVDWANPDASGPLPTNPGYATVGNYTVTLRVRDNQNPSETATSTVVVNVVATDIDPVAVAIPASRLPAYSGHVGQPIQLDGTASFDPDLDVITTYTWDSDGDGVYGGPNDVTGPTPSITYNAPYTGQVGLRVTANGKTSTNTAIADIYASPNDFYIESISSSNIVFGSSADVQVVVKNATNSTGTWNGVSVRFFNGDPLGNGVQVGGNYTVNLAPEGTATLNVSLTNLNGLELVYVYVDSTKVIPEWDERNNTASVNVAAYPEVAITGNGVEIESGDTTPSLVDHTAFGAVNTSAASVTRVYTIANTGLGALNLSGIAPNYVTLSGSADFTVSLQPTTPVAHTVGTTTFSVTFDPSSDGLKSAVVSIANNDQTKNPYTFTVSGSGMTTPVITDEPDGGSHQVYDNVTLSVTATGTPTLTYQWSKDGVPIEGATSSQYIIAPLTREKAGSYTVVVTNNAGSDTSAPAVLFAVPRELLRTDDDMVVPGFPVTDLYRPLSGVIGPNGAFVVNALATVGPGGITSGNDQVIITNVSGTLSAIGQESQSVGSGTLSRLFYYMNAPANGTAHYRAILNGGTAADDTAYFVSQDGQSLEILSREGDESPEGGLTFSGHIAPPAISQSGIVYFDSKLLGPGVTAKNDTGVWFDNAGSQGTLVREGDRAPTGNSVADQAWFGQIMAGSVVAGEEAASFICDLQADPLNAANKTSGLRNTGVFTGVAGDVSLVVRKGDVIADLPIRGFNALAVSPDGGHAFVAHLTVGGPISTANSLALFYKPVDGEPVFVAQKGQTLPNTGVINVFERFFAADNGQVIFEVTLTNMTSSDNALCRWTAADGIEVLMQEGDASPGGGVYGALRSLSVSGNGKVMIQDSRAVWRDVGAGMELVVKVGDTVFYGGLPRTALSLAVNDEMANTRRAGGGFGGTINNDGSVLAIMSVGSGQYTTQIYP